jgi:Glycosyl transferase family 2
MRAVNRDLCMNPTLSVVMPTFNGERYVAAALESIRGQATKDIEVIVVDDGSSDSTLDKVGSFAGKLSIRLLTAGRTGNWVAASNLGLREAKGKWISFLHQDDIWLPGRMTRIRPELQDSNRVLIIHNAEFIGPRDERLGKWTCPLRDGYVSPDELLDKLLVQNFIAIPSPIFRRTIAIESGGLDERLWFSADWDLWLRLGSMHPSLFINEVLTGFRIHPASQTVARWTAPGEWDEQLSVVLERHLQSWDVSGKRRGKVERMAGFSIAVNSALSAISRGESVSPSPLLLKLLGLGPVDCFGYLRRSRIVQRIRARLGMKKTLLLSARRNPESRGPLAEWEHDSAGHGIPRGCRCPKLKS